MQSDGDILIKAKLDTGLLRKEISKMEKQLVDAKSKAEDLQKEAEIKKIDIEVNTQKLKEAQKELEILKEKRKEAWASGIPLVSDKATRKVDEQYTLINSIKQQLLEQNAEYENMQGEIAKINKQQDMYYNSLKQSHTQLEANKQAIKEATAPIKETTQETAEVSKETGKIDLGVGKIIKKVVKWGLAVFSVRSAYLFVRSSVATISKYDEQLGANIEYIRYALAMAIKPIIEWIVNAVYTLMQYVAYIVKAWFNIDLFANASAKNFNKANGNAKKLQRTMAGFDEMNVLSSNKDSGGVGTNLDLSKSLKDVQIPGWVKWIADNKETILAVVGAIAGLFAVSKITKLFGPLEHLGTLLGTGTGGLLNLLTGISALSIIAISIYLSEEFKKTREEISQLYDKSQKHVREQISKETDVNQLLAQQQALYGSINYSINANKEGTAILYNWADKVSGASKEELENARKSVSYTKDRVEQMQKITREQGIEYDTGLKIISNLYDSIRYNMLLQQGLNKNSEKYKEIEEINKQTAMYMGEIIVNLQQQGYSYDEIAKKLGLTKELVKNLAGKYQATIDVQTNMPTQQQQQKTISSWWKDFKKAFTNVVNLGQQGLKLIFGNLFNANALGGVVKYASGGIINAPGHGVPIAGERGMEGIVPMTHQDQMELLGQTIAKYMVVDLTNITTLDGRVLARQVSKVQANNNFATNR